MILVNMSIHQNIECCTTATGGGFNQLLRNNGPHVHRKVNQHLSLCAFRYQMENTVNCLVSIVGMQGCQYQVAGFGKGQGKLHGLTGTDFADEDNVRSLPQRRFQSGIF